METGAPTFGTGHDLLQDRGPRISLGINTPRCCIFHPSCCDIPMSLCVFYTGRLDVKAVESWSETNYSSQFIRADALKAGLGDVYNTLPPMKSMGWVKILMYDTPKNLNECDSFTLEIGKVLESVPPPKNAPEPGPVLVIRLEHRGVHAHFPKNPKNLAKKPGLSVLLSENNGRGYTLNGGILGDRDAQDLLRRTKLVEPFRSLSQDWANPEVLPMWYAMLAWYYAQKPGRPSIKWETQFRSHFIAALKAIKKSRENQEKKGLCKLEEDIKSEDEGSAETKVKRELEDETDEHIKRESVEENTCTSVKMEESDEDGEEDEVVEESCDDNNDGDYLPGSDDIDDDD